MRTLKLIAKNFDNGNEIKDVFLQLKQVKA